MSKNKKAASSKKMVANSTPKATPKTARTTPNKINSKKVEFIADKINQMNKRFENLIEECQVALKKLNEPTITAEI